MGLDLEKFFKELISAMEFGDIDENCEMEIWAKLYRDAKYGLEIYGGKQ